MSFKKHEDMVRKLLDVIEMVAEDIEEAEYDSPEEFQVTLELVERLREELLSLID